MAQIEKKPVLSLCIPIYNRIAYLERQLTRFLEDKQLFEEQVQLIVSDNCSTDDLRSCCLKYQQQGLKLTYHRNEFNLGPDGNFDWCFHHADGKYVWLLGSDDVPVPGLLHKIVYALEESDFGWLHLSMSKQNNGLLLFDTPDDMAISVNYWVTFMSANIIRTKSLKSIDLSEYRKSFLIQVPAFLNACYSYKTNCILYLPLVFEEGSDAVNNGGYNIFEVFVTNLYGIYESFIEKGMLSVRAYNKMIKIEYRFFLLDFIIRLVILRKESNFKTDGCWRRLFKYYWDKPYFYFYLMTGLTQRFLSKISL